MVQPCQEAQHHQAMDVGGCDAQSGRDCRQRASLCDGIPHSSAIIRVHQGPRAEGTQQRQRWGLRPSHWEGKQWGDWWNGLGHLPLELG